MPPQPTPTRSLTGRHNLIHSRTLVYVASVPPRDLSFFDLAFGPGTVLRKIWPAILVHTLFATAVVVITRETDYNLAIQPVLVSVVGMVLGFVISYRAVSGYDRYWMGRSTWADVVRNCRTLARLVWFHVPLRMQASKEGVTKEEAERVLEEKKVFIDLIEGFAFALKHHLRHEPGPYYQDLYPMLGSLEMSPYCQHWFQVDRNAVNPTNLARSIPVDGLPTHTGQYGTFPINSAETAPLLPATPPDRSQRITTVNTTLVPGVSFLQRLGRWISQGRGHQVKEENHSKDLTNGSSLPLELIGLMSSYLATIEDRGTVPGMSLGPMIGSLQGLEDALTNLEKILTTPLPFVYSAHIRHTVWLYLFFLPFQLCETFGYYVIPGIAVASFLYLGFMAAGEEIEQPFGYDKNDLDLDFFCRQIIRADLEDIRQISCPHSDLGIPGVVEKGSSLGHGVVVDAGWRLQATARNGASPPVFSTERYFSDPNATLVGGRHTGTSTQDIVIVSGTADYAH